MMREVIAGLCCLALAGAARAARGVWKEMLTLDFESAFPWAGWEVLDKFAADGDEYCWGEVSTAEGAPSDIPDPTWCGWCAAGGAEGYDPLSAVYPSNCKSWLMTTGSIDISDSADVTVDFYRWVNTEVDADKLWVGVSVDGGLSYHKAWLTYAEGYSVSGDVSSWVKEVADLSNVEGLGDVAADETLVKIAIVFESNGSVEFDGAFIDDVVIWKYVWSDDVPATICGQAPSEAGPGMALAALLFAGSLLALKRKAAFAGA